MFTFNGTTLMEYYIKEGWQLNPNEKVVSAITKRIAICEGACPCTGNAANDHADIMCPCKDYMENDTCHCGLYIKKDE